MQMNGGVCLYAATSHCVQVCDLVRPGPGLGVHAYVNLCAAECHSV